MGNDDTISGPFQVKSLEREARHSFTREFTNNLFQPRNSSVPGKVIQDQHQLGDDDLDSDTPLAEPPLRIYECNNYETCLDLAASLNWENFTCKGCDRNINKNLFWLARQNQRKDGVARALCQLPPIELVEAEDPEVGNK